MTDRLLPSVDGVLLAFLWSGMMGFAVVHSVTLLQSSGERAVSLIRLAWFLGLCLVAAASGYVVLLGDGGTDAESSDA